MLDQPMIPLNIPMALAALGAIREGRQTMDRIVLAEWIQEEIRKAVE